MDGCQISRKTPVSTLSETRLQHGRVVRTALLPVGGHQGSQGFTRGRQGLPEMVNLSLGDNDGTRMDLQVSDCPGTGETRTFLLLDRWEVQVGTALVGPLSKAWKASGLVF